MLTRNDFKVKGRSIYRNGKLVAEITGRREHHWRYGVHSTLAANIGGERYPATYRNAGITVSPTFAYFDDAVRDTINELIARDARAKGEI